MPYHIKGKAAQIFAAFGNSALLAPNTTSAKPAVQFIGTDREAQAHKRILNQRAASDRSAGLLKVLVGGAEGNPLKKPDEDYEVYNKNFVCQHFAFLSDDTLHFNSLMLMYRKDDPRQWMLGFIKDTQAAPKDREVVLFSGFDLNQFILKSSNNVAASGSYLTQFTELLGSAALKKLVKTLVNETDGVNQHAERLDWLLREIRLNQDNKVALKDPVDISDFDWGRLFAKDPILDLIFKYNIHKDIHLSFATLKECMKEDSTLRKRLEALELNPDDDRGLFNKNLMKMTLVFFEEGSLSNNQNLLKDKEFIRLFGPHTKSREQINMLAFIYQENKPREIYDPELILDILDDEVRLGTLSRLVAMGITDGAPELFKKKNEKKLEQLKCIHELDNEDHKRLILIFWFKGNYTIDAYKKIVAAAKQYPLMASTLIAADKDGTVNGGIDGLRELALKPERHLPQSIEHHFFPDSSDNYYARMLRDLSVSELEEACNALHVLKTSELDSLKQREISKAVVSKDQKGIELRLFLPEIAHIPDIAHRKALIELLYLGVFHSKAEQELRDHIKTLNDGELTTQASSLCDRYICVNRVLFLGIDPKVAIWAAGAQDPKARRFRQIILDIDKQCHFIDEHLASSNEYRPKADKWQKEQGNYRKGLYDIASRILMNPTSTKADLEQAIVDIKTIEKKVLIIVDPPVESFFYKALIAITNLLITALSVGIANYLKYRQTGNPWFFTQTQSGEEVRALGQQLVTAIQP